MSANWYLSRRSIHGPSKATGSALGFGSSTAASFEINPIDGDGGDNSIYRLSATGAGHVIDGSTTPTGSDNDTLKEYMNRVTDEFEATLQLSDDDNDTIGRTSPTDDQFASRHDDLKHREMADSSSSDEDEQPQTASMNKRRAQSPPIPHLRDLTVVDPFDPFRKTKKAAEAEKKTDDATPIPNRMTSPYTYRDGSPPVRKLAYKVVKGKAPQPPTLTNTSVISRSNENLATNGNNSLHRVVYSRSEKRPAPQPPQIYEQDFWKAVEEESNRTVSRSGAVETRVKRQKQKAEKTPENGSNETINLTFREKMARFFGLTGKRKGRDRGRVTVTGRYDSNIHYGTSRYGTGQTLQSFSFAHSKIYTSRPNTDGPQMEGGNIDIAKPQANGVVRIQRRVTGPNLQNQNLRWANRDSGFAGSSNSDSFHRRSDLPTRPFSTGQSSDLHIRY